LDERSACHKANTKFTHTQTSMSLFVCVFVNNKEHAGARLISSSLTKHIILLGCPDATRLCGRTENIPSAKIVKSQWRLIVPNVGRNKLSQQGSVRGKGHGGKAV
jgi:hypothetical protein